jgi:hypothetical protein
MADNSKPNRGSNVEKAKSNRWTSDPGTVERRDRDRLDTGAQADDLEIVNRTGAGFPTPRRYDQPQHRDKS